MGKPGYTGLQRILLATRYSAQGLLASWRHESAFRQETALAVVTIPLGLWLGDSALERALLVAAILQVLIVELLNSAIEAAIDRMGDGEHELSGRSKDMGSAAVLLSLLLAGVVWGLVLLS